MNDMKNLMNTAAVEHHSYGIYCYPLNKDELQINLKTAKDVEAVTLRYGDPFLGESRDGEWHAELTEVAVTERKELPGHLWWSATVRPAFKRCKYCFTLTGGGGSLLYFENGFFSADDYRRRPGSALFFAFPWMNPVDFCAPPTWPQDTVWYQIFLSRFCRGTGGDAVPPAGLREWAGPDVPVSNREEFGGNLQGLSDRLDYLQELGISGLYLNPINLSSSQHKYDTTDYLAVDPSFGTKAQVATLVKEAHRRRMRVMLDGVFNHSGWDFFAWQDVRKNRRRSKYADWYMVKDWDFPDRPGDNALRDRYYSFAFCDTMPKLNTNNPGVREYFLSVCETWVREYDIDALRLDVANEVSHEFIRELKGRLCALKPDFFIVGEIWNDAMPWLGGDQCDSVINYPLRSAIISFALDEDKDVRFLQLGLNACQVMYPAQVERVLINQLDSHDTIRLVSKTGDRDIALLQFALLFSLAGSVCLYYGSEVLLEGVDDTDSRRCMPWKEIAGGRYKEELSFMTALIALRTGHAAMRALPFDFVYDGDDPRGKGRVVHLVKKDPQTGRRLHVVANFGRKPYTAARQEGAVLLSRRATGGGWTLERGGLLIFEA